MHVSAISCQTTSTNETLFECVFMLEIHPAPQNADHSWAPFDINAWVGKIKVSWVYFWTQIDAGGCDVSFCILPYDAALAAAWSVKLVFVSWYASSVGQDWNTAQKSLPSVWRADMGIVALWSFTQFVTWCVCALPSVVFCLRDILNGLIRWLISLHTKQNLSKSTEDPCG